MFDKITFLLTSSEKRVIALLLIMSFFLSIIEAFGIAAIMPFISAAANPELIYSNIYFKMAYDFFEISSSQEFIVLFGGVLIIFYIFRAIFTVYHGYLMISFSMNKYASFSNKLFSNYVNMTYSEFSNRNTANMTKVIITEASQLSFLIQSILS